MSCSSPKADASELPFCSTDGGFGLLLLLPGDAFTEFLFRYR
ncbi:Unknown protein sequence [Pseudomonas syringae pv. maculicola]|nr:Unknown protein sequence [Pseudomonas syringae pv. maculicola]